MSSGMAGRASGPTDIKLATANSRISASSCRNSLTHRSTGGASAGRLPTSAHRAAARLSSERSSVPAVKTFRTAGSSGAIRPSDTMAAARSRWPAAPAISINGAIASVAEPPIRPSASIAPERRSGSRRASTSRGTAPRAPGPISPSIRITTARVSASPSSRARVRAAVADTPIRMRAHEASERTSASSSLRAASSDATAGRCRDRVPPGRTQPCCARTTPHRSGDR